MQKAAFVTGVASLRADSYVAPSPVVSRRPKCSNFPRRRRVSACASPKPATRTPTANPQDVLSPGELEEWAAIAATVAELAPALPADGVVSKAFGWGKLSQRFWRGDRVEEKPSIARVNESLAFLREEIGLSDAEIGSVILKKFPEALNMDVAERMAANMNYLKTTWPAFSGVGGDGRLKAAVLEQPAILGFSVDCGGDCMSECNRCWARF